MQICILTAYGKILDLLHTVVVDPVCPRSAAGTGMLLSRQLQLHMASVCVFINIFYDYIFQSEKFCCIIFHRAFRLGSVKSYAQF